MAFETSTATDMADLLTKLNTFATANGWTSDELNTGTGELALHKNSCYVSFRWDPATPLHLSVHQALGYTGGNEPGAHPDDSGNGFNTSASHTNANLLTERCVESLGNGSFPSYHFFEDDDGTHFYIHVVVQISASIYRHFGFGKFDKFGDWTGGEYAYGHYRSTSPGQATSVVETCLLDGLFNDSGAAARRAATIHAEGLPGMGGSQKWGQVWAGNGALTLPDDTAAQAKIDVQGGFRGGPIARNFGWIPKGATDGLIPTYQIALFYRNRSNGNVYFLGTQPDVRGINIRHFAAAEEVTIGSDVWVIFPMQLRTLTAVAQRTYYSGIAYRKLT